MAAEQRPGGVAHGGEIVSVEQHAAARGLGQAADHVEHGGFPAAGRPHNGNELARQDFNVDAAEGGHVHLARTIDLPQIFSLEYRLQHQLPFESEQRSGIEIF